MMLCSSCKQLFTYL